MSGTDPDRPSGGRPHPPASHVTERRPAAGGPADRLPQAHRRSADQSSYARPAPPQLPAAELADRIRSVARPEVAARLSDGVVSLRVWRPADAPAIVDGLHDGSAARWIVGMPHPYGPDEAADFLARAERELAAAVYAHLAVTGAASGRVLGAVGLHFRHDRQAGEIGYWTHPAERGHGIARRAVALVTRWAFEELGLPRLELIIHPLNFESQIIASRSGFRREGLLRSYLEHRGLRNDYYSFARLPDDVPPRPHPVLSLADGARLRPWQMRDAEAALAMLTSDEQITRWCVDIRPDMTLDEERRFIAETARSWFEDGLPGFAIVDPDSGELLGSCCAHRSRFAGVAELGYLVRAAARGRGIGAAALTAVTDWVLADGCYEACELLIAPDNAASIGAAERSGYRRSGEIRRCSTLGAAGGLYEVWRRTR